MQTNPSPTYIGLYYPTIHFQSDNWLKIAALHWDKIGRIIPRGFPTNDSIAVKVLKNELGFIVDCDPVYYEIDNVALEYQNFLTENIDELSSTYGIKQKQRWQKNPDNPAAGARERNWRFWEPRRNHLDPRLGYIHAAGKMTHELKEILIRENLGELYKESDYWIGMHPSLVKLYMLRLASEMARNRGFIPLTDGDLYHLATTGYSLGQVASILLGNPQLRHNVFIQEEVQHRLISMSIETIIPQNLDHIDISKIVELRQKYPDELLNFQTHIRNITKNLDHLNGITNQQDLQNHLDILYTKNLKTPLENLKNSMKSLKIETVLTSFNVEIGIGGAFLAWLLTQNPVLSAAGSLALTLLPITYNFQKQQNEKIESSPIGFLLRTEAEISAEEMAKRQITKAHNLVNAGIRY